MAKREKQTKRKDGPNTEKIFTPITTKTFSPVRVESGKIRITSDRDVVIEVQAMNPATGHYIKQNLQTGLYEVKADGKPFKGVPKKKLVLAPANPVIDRETAQQGEKAVIDYLNKKAQRQ
ncbi:hypothetical protein GCM10023189_32920 [Nibrella saemangeumensis]|uniref:Uncharacterized protein n=1 Tax=Nibrella saemangeumensis TaxID=1084526 RepID=A0ABP8N2J2_9BACT